MLKLSWKTRYVITMWIIVQNFLYRKSEAGGGVILEYSYRFAGPRIVLRSTATGLQRVPSLLVLTDVVTVSCSHYHPGIRGTVLSGA